MTHLKLSQLTSSQKIAIIIISLGAEQGGKILLKLSPEEAHRVITALSHMPQVEKTLVTKVLKEFNLLQNPKAKTWHITKESSQSFLKATVAKDRSRATNVETRLSAIEGVAGQDLALILAHEHPQTIALVISHATSEQGAMLIKTLPDALKSEVLMRAAQIQPVNAQVILDLNEKLQQLLTHKTQGKKLRLGGSEKVAALLSALNSDNQHEKILTEIAIKDPALATQIREQMFTFADLTKIPPPLLLELYKETQLLWPLALRGASPQVIQHLMSALSKNAQKQLREDLDNGVSIPLTQVKEARTQMTKKAQELIIRNNINLI